MENSIDKLTTSAANRDIRLAKKNGDMMICQTKLGNLFLSHNAGIFTLETQATFANGEIVDGRIVASGNAAQIRAELKNVYVVIA